MDGLNKKHVTHRKQRIKENKAMITYTHVIKNILYSGWDETGTCYTQTVEQRTKENEWNETRTCYTQTVEQRTKENEWNETRTCYTWTVENKRY